MDNLKEEEVVNFIKTNLKNKKLREALRKEGWVYLNDKNNKFYSSYRGKFMLHLDTIRPFEVEKVFNDFSKDLKILLEIDLKEFLSDELYGKYERIILEINKAEERKKKIAKMKAWIKKIVIARGEYVRDLRERGIIPQLKR